MIFEYKPYYNNLVRASIIDMIFITIFVVTFILIVYGDYRHKNLTKKTITFRLLYLLIGTFICVFTFSDTNYDLLKDDPNETVSTCGVIQSVDKPRKSARYNYNGDVVRPRILTINNEEYYIAYNGRYNTNAYVEIEYLPNSKVIMAINYCEDD